MIWATLIFFASFSLSLYTNVARKSFVLWACRAVGNVGALVSHVFKTQHMYLKALSRL